MASALLASRQVSSCLLSQRHSARSSAFRSRPAPFTPARRVFARAQESEESAVPTNELAELEEDPVLEAVLEAGDAADVAEADAAGVQDAEADAGEAGFMDLWEAREGGEEDTSAQVQDENFELDEEDPDLVAAVEAAQELGLLDGYDYEEDLRLAAALDEGEDQVKSKQELAELLAARMQDPEDGLEGELEGLARAVLSKGELEEVELEDEVPALSSDRYAEVPLSHEDKEAIAPLKLSKYELKNLLPQDWDQINVDFFSKKKDEDIPLPEFRLNILWKDNQYLGVAIDQVYSRGQVSPLTEYYFWPRNDAWEDLRGNLEGRPWIAERDRIVLLNRLTQLINYWQDDQVKHSVEEARAEFPDCAFTMA